MNPNLEDNQITPDTPLSPPPVEPTTPSAPEALPGPPSLAPISVPAPMPTPSPAWFKNVWLWVSVVLFLALASLSGYVLLQDKSDSTNKNSSMNTDPTPAVADIDDTTNETPDPIVAADPYDGWSTFSSRFDEMTFKYPATLEVKEIMADDPSPHQPQYKNGFYELSIRDKNSSDADSYVISIDDKPWGCTGPPSGHEIKSYDSIIGKSPIKLTEICGNDSLDRTIFAMVKLGSENATLYIDQPFYRNNKATAELILSSFTNVGKR